MSTKRRRMFEELGLLSEELPTNPLHDLGIEPGFARTLLGESAAEKRDLELVAKSTYRALSRLYHPDTGDQPNSDKFHGISSALKQIEDASPSQLLRWCKVERGSASSQAVSSLKEQNQQLLEQASEVIGRTLRLGNHALHYSQLSLSQGLLAQRKGMPLLIRNDTETGTINVQRGVVLNREEAFMDDADDAYDAEEDEVLIETRAMNFHRFLSNHDSFGIPNGSRIALYMDEAGRASILEPDLSFVMDVSGPIAKHRQENANKKKRTKERIVDELGKKWSKAGIATLQTAIVGLDNIRDAEMQTTIFPRDKRGYETWSIPMEVVGHVSNAEHLKRKSVQKTGARAIASSVYTPSSAAYFDLTAIPVEQLIVGDADYSPLLVSAQDLLLYNPEIQMPVLTDAKILGIIGSHSDSSSEIV